MAQEPFPGDGSELSHATDLIVSTLLAWAKFGLTMKNLGCRLVPALTRTYLRQLQIHATRRTHA
jgi:hypothetical protein